MPGQCDVLLVFVNEKEKEAILHVFHETCQKIPELHPGDVLMYYDFGVIGGARVMGIQTEMGSVTRGGSVPAVAEALVEIKPDYVILVGVAFGMDPGKQPIGDILVSRKLSLYETKKLVLKDGIEIEITRGDTASAPERILSRFRALSGQPFWQGAKVHFEQILSGEKLIDNPRFKEKLQKEYPEAAGGEMEAAGAYVAAEFRKRDWLVVKAVCDYADGNKGHNKDERQELAASNAARFVFHVLEKGKFAGNSIKARTAGSERRTVPEGKDEKVTPSPGLLSDTGGNIEEPGFEKPQWADITGVDKYGGYADFSINRVTQRMRLIPPGTFLMGSPGDEPERDDDETQHWVTLTHGFWLADTACTQALWQTVMGGNPAGFKGKQRPVEKVSWKDCMKFLDKLNRLKPKLELRLPTEAEWEYACRAGTTTPFSFGDNITPEQVNYNGNKPYAGGKKGLYRKETVDVKSLPCNNWGLYQMHGNVWEWCSDWYGEYGIDAVTDPEGLPNGVNRVLRGGGWINYGRLVRSAYRYWFAPSYRRHARGLRLAQGQKG